MTQTGDTPGSEEEEKPQGIFRRIAGWASYLALRLLPGAALVLVGFLVFQGAANRVVTAVSDYFLGPVMPGILSLEPPQVYTRERLVNDRFRQANWLENQLAVTNERTTIDDIGRVLSTIQRQTGIQVELTNRAKEAVEEKDQTETTENTTAPVVTAMGSFGQRLMETDKLRTRLRTDLMDTLLDDGHDLEGNTLYRLNFDAVVMPTVGERRYPGTAVYVIRARNPYAPLKEEPCADAPCKTDMAGDVPETRHLQALKQKQLNDDIELLRDWQTEIQRFLTRVVEHRVEQFQAKGRLDNPVDPKEDIALDWYMRLRLVENFLDAIVLDPEVWPLCRGEPGDDPQGVTRIVERTEENVFRCQDWIAQTLGLKWRSGDVVRDPGFDFSNPGAESIEASFRRAIRLAHHINVVRDEVGWEAHRARSADPEAFEAPRYEDLDRKKALLRMITVWKAMREWDLLNPPPPAGTATDAKAVPEQNAGTDATELPSREERLFQRLMVYQDYDPTDATLDAARTQLLGERLSGPKFKSGAETCIPEDVQQRSAAEARFNYYRCVMIYAQAGQTADNLIAEFVVARLRNELPIYDWKNHLSLGNFLDVNLAGCGTTGCRIQVTQHKHVPITEFIGGREYLADAEPIAEKVQFGAFFDSFLSGSDGKNALALGTDKAGPNFFNRLLARHDTPIPVELDNDGIALARRLVENGGLGLVETTPFISVKELNETQARQRQEILGCLEVAEQLSLSAVARAEAYFACRLRHWVDAKRSDVSVYGVSPRAGSGDDLVGSMQELDRRMAASASLFQTAQPSITASDRLTNTQVKANPSVIGFSVPPGRQSSAKASRDHIETATFGWAIRPERMANGEGYLASRHRLSAVISVPSWWKRIEFEVEACWVTSEQIAALRQSVAQSRAKDSSQDRNVYEALCQIVDAAADGFAHSFEIQVPRRVAEITDRFNFDFIKAPYFYRDFIIDAEKREGLALEAGRPGKMVLHGERLWRGTFVTVNQQPANSIVVLPDMKGVVASFDCVRPPDGSFHVVNYSKSLAGGGGVPIEVPMQVWTSQGSTSPLRVKVYPFIQRTPDEKPCWLSSK